MRRTGARTYYLNNRRRRPLKRREKMALRFETKGAVAAAMAMAVSAWASPVSPAIGTVTAAGSFRIDRSTVRGNATLFDGSTIETFTAMASLELANGTVRLAAFSKARVFGDRLSLEKGAGELEHAGGIRIEGL